jgi:HEAT repeat protein
VADLRLALSIREHQYPVWIACSGLTGRMGFASAAAPELQALLDCNSHAVRQLAAVTLCEVAPQDASAALPQAIDLLSSSDPDWRLRAIGMLHRLGKVEEQRPRLAILLHDPDEKVRQAAAEPAQFFEHVMR